MAGTSLRHKDELHRRIRALEAERDALKVEKAGAMSALGMARSEITTLKNRVAEADRVIEKLSEGGVVWMDGAYRGIKKKAPR
jgi:chromosome segregation ATPase